jgi:hypothetical protein
LEQGDVEEMKKTGIEMPDIVGTHLAGDRTVEVVYSGTRFASTPSMQNPKDSLHRTWRSEDSFDEVGDEISNGHCSLPC